MRIAFTRSRSGGLLNRPSPRKRLLPKKKTSSGFEFVSGLAAGASAMPAKWSRRVFSFRFYEGKISAPVTLHPVPSENHIRQQCLDSSVGGTRLPGWRGRIRTQKRRRKLSL